jgi:hypothetical protein
MRPMLSIDFGNSYTKVALRPDSDSVTQLLTDSSLKLDDLHACVPTVAASYIQGAKEEWYYGTDVMKFREETPGLTVHRNWKPCFFETQDSKKDHRQHAGTCSTNSKHGSVGLLTAPAGVTPEVWETIKATVPAESVASLWEKLQGQDGTPAPPAFSGEETDLDHKHIGRGFFHWLLEFVDPLCRARLGVRAAEIPVRVSLPSFGSMTKAKLLLREILEDAGWQLDDRAPVLHEPLSNAIGAFSEGTNATHTISTGTFPCYGKMFHNTGMLSRIREALLADGPNTAWVLIADVGGYTADFAMVGLNLRDIDAGLDGEIDGKPRLTHNSKPLGVTDLDKRVRDLLSPSKQKALDKVIADPDQQRLEAFHKNCYGYLGRHSLGRNLVIGGSPTEKEQIREVVAQFGEQVADDAEVFLSIHQYTYIDDLILTGGGTLIPAVRDALCNRLSHYGVKKVHLHLPKGEPPRFPVPCHPLGSVLVRGATAVGGASLYFDSASTEE